MKKIFLLVMFSFLLFSCANIDRAAQYSFSGYDINNLYGENVAVVDQVKYTDSGVEIDVRLKLILPSNEQEILREDFRNRYPNVNKVNLIVRP